LSSILVCNCGAKIRINSESFGKKVQCQKCSNFLDFPSTPKLPYLPTPNSKNRENFKNETTCPFCIEQIPENSFVCPICKEDLTKNFSNNSKCTACSEKIPKSSMSCPFCGEKFISPFRLTNEQTENLIFDHFNKLANTPHNIKREAFTIATIIFFICTLALASFLVLMIFESHFDVLAFQFICSVLILFLSFTGVLFLLDKKAKNMQNYTDPAKFFKTYFNCLKGQKASFAFHSVSPMGKLSQKTRPIFFESINLDDTSHNIETIKGFKKYWRSILIGTNKYTNSIKIKSIKTVEVLENIAIIEITLKLLRFDTFTGADKKKELATIQKTLLKHNNKWYVAEGELQGCLDFATFKERV